MQYLTKYHTPIAAAGLLCLAIYQLTVGDYPHAWHAFLVGLGLLGIHLSLPDSLEEKDQPKDS